MHTRKGVENVIAAGILSAKIKEKVKMKNEKGKVKIYTKTGDTGKTSLYGGKRVGKDDPHVDAYGTVDELNSVLGMLIAHLPASEATLSSCLLSLQADLFSIGAYLAGNETQSLLNIQKRVSQMEQWVDEMDEKLPSLKQFILPSGSLASAQAHLARTVARRAERSIVALHHDKNIPSSIFQYINRLSDFLFVTARYLNKVEGTQDVLWVS